MRVAVLQTPEVRERGRGEGHVQDAPQGEWPRGSAALSLGRAGPAPSPLWASVPAPEDKGGTRRAQRSVLRLGGVPLVHAALVASRSWGFIAHLGVQRKPRWLPRPRHGLVQTEQRLVWRRESSRHVWGSGRLLGDPAAQSSLFRGYKGAGEGEGLRGGARVCSGAAGESAGRSGHAPRVQCAVGYTNKDRLGRKWQKPSPI